MPSLFWTDVPSITATLGSFLLKSAARLLFLLLFLLTSSLASLLVVIFILLLFFGLLFLLPVLLTQLFAFVCFKFWQASMIHILNNAYNISTDIPATSILHASIQACWLCISFYSYDSYVDTYYVLEYAFVCVLCVCTVIYTY